MRKFLTILLVSIIILSSNAQVKLDDFGRIVLNAYLPDDFSMPAEAKNYLITKLSQIASNNGMSGSEANSRFIITASVNIGTKDIIAGPPQMIAQNIEITLFIGDAISNTIFANTSLSIKGVGTNENKAFIEALKMINPKNKEIASFLEDGKSKIVNYYATQCDFLIKNARTLVGQEKYDEAIYKLAQVPDICEDCYFRTLDTLSQIYQQKIDADCAVKFNKAKSVWASEQKPSGAEKAGDVLSTIHPEATCQTDVQSFINKIDAKLKADERARWQFKMKQYNDKIAANKERMRIAEGKSIRDDTYRENQSTRDASYKENQSKRDASYRENQSKRDSKYRESQSNRNYELDKIKVSAYREVAVNMLGICLKQSPITTFFGINIIK